MPDHPPLILASTSRYRAALLARLGLPFETVAPEVDERSLEEPGLEPRAAAERLARAKAAAVAARRPGAIVIGSDQVCAAGDQVLHKPGTRERAVEQLLALAGRTHELITAVAVQAPGRVLEHTDVSRLTMRPLERAALERYVDADQPLDCAGAYKLEERGVALFSRIECADASAITGLPLMALVEMLDSLGIVVP
jgi:septum formation protein